ncbi:hypothetical protein MHYP_G00293600 [Metynnis hypsauchen]
MHSEVKLLFISIILVLFKILLQGCTTGLVGQCPAKFGDFSYSSTSDHTLLRFARFRWCVWIVKLSDCAGRSSSGLDQCTPALLFGPNNKPAFQEKKMFFYVGEFKNTVIQCLPFCHIKFGIRGSLKGNSTHFSTFLFNSINDIQGHPGWFDVAHCRDSAFFTVVVMGTRACHVYNINIAILFTVQNHQ